MRQASMFDVTGFTPVPSDMMVVSGAAREVFTLLRSSNAIPYAVIELHQHNDGRWMWSSSFNLSNGSGRCYKVGPKWGNFAASRSEAMVRAKREMLQEMGGSEACGSVSRIKSWMKELEE